MWTIFYLANFCKAISLSTSTVARYIVTSTDLFLAFPRFDFAERKCVSDDDEIAPYIPNERKKIINGRLGGARA